MTVRNSVPRIRNVRWKIPQSNIVPLPTSKLDDAQTMLITHSRRIATGIKFEEMAGFFVIAWSKDGNYSHSYRIDGTECVIGFSLAPNFVAEALRRSMHEDGHW